VRCPLTASHDTAGERVGNLRVRLGSSRVPDLVWTWHSELMIQEHVLTGFREAGFTGFDTRPVAEVRFPRSSKEAREPPRLWEVVVTGWGGEAGRESGIEMVYYCEGCRRLEYTDCERPECLIDPSRWDGSDFFIVWPLPKFIFVTARVADLIRREGYKGAQLVRPVDMGICDGSGFSPGPPPPGRQVNGPEAYPGVKVRRWPEGERVSRRPAWVMQENQTERGPTPPEGGA
jgi:hypothetical protein